MDHPYARRPLLLLASEARLSSSRGVGLARALRAALLEQSGGSALPAVLSGHQANGTPTQEPHVAFVPRPFVGHTHADASLMGIAIVLPREISTEARGQLLLLVASLETRRQIDGDGTGAPDAY
jgi:CRISPR-associated protein Csb2